MISLKDDLNGLHKDTCIKVYDPIDKRLVGIYPSFAKAAHKLGLSASQVQQRCTTKTRVFSSKYGKEVACRLSRLKPEDEELMSKCSKYQFL
jgi:hypothetical protein